MQHLFPGSQVIVNPSFAAELCGKVGEVVFVHFGPVQVSVGGDCFWFKPDELTPVTPESRPTAQEAADNGD